jgi:hypothetical protein
MAPKSLAAVVDRDMHSNRAVCIFRTILLTLTASVTPRFSMEFICMETKEVGVAVLVSKASSLGAEKEACGIDSLKKTARQSSKHEASATTATLHEALATSTLCYASKIQV